MNIEQETHPPSRSMPQNNYIDDFIRENGRAFDYEFKRKKSVARSAATLKRAAKRLRGVKARIFAKKCHVRKIENRKAHRAARNESRACQVEPIPTFLLDRNVSNITVTDKVPPASKGNKLVVSRKVPVGKVGGVADIEMFRSLKTGKRKRYSWKRVVVKPCFVSEDFTRKAPRYERFIRPMALRHKVAHVTHPGLQTTFRLPIVGMKKNPHSDLCTNLGVLSKGSLIEVNVSSFGMVLGGDKVVVGKYAQVTNDPENDGCVNAVLLV